MCTPDRQAAPAPSAAKDRESIPLWQQQTPLALLRVGRLRVSVGIFQQEAALPGGQRQLLLKLRDPQSRYSRNISPSLPSLWQPDAPFCPLALDSLRGGLPFLRI